MTNYKPKGILLGTGNLGTGKTSWALGAYPLKDTVYIYEQWGK